MLPNGVYANVRKELAHVFGPRNSASITVQSCVHVTATGLGRPISNLVLQGVRGIGRGTTSGPQTRACPIECGKGSRVSPSGHNTGLLGSGTIWCRQTLPKVTQMHQMQRRPRRRVHTTSPLTSTQTETGQGRGQG